MEMQQMAKVNIEGLAQLAGRKHTVTGSLADISADLALGSPASQLLAYASKFTTLTVTDSGQASAFELREIYEAVTARVSISGIKTVTGTAQEVAALYAAQKAKEVTGLGNEAVTLSSGLIDAAELVAIDKATSGTITISGPVTLQGTLADVSKILKAKAKAITLEPGAEVVLTDTSISGASALKILKALSSLTSGLIDASSVATLQGSAADIAALYAAGISNLEETTITLTGATVAAADLLNVDEGTDVDVNAASVKTIKGSAAEVADVFAAADEGTIDGLRENTKITLVGTEANAQDLLAVDAGTTAKLSVAKLKTVTGSAADVAAVYDAQKSAKTISGLGNEKVILEGEASVSDLAAINAATKGQIDASNVTELTGGLSEINTLLSTLPKEISGLGTQSIVLTDTALTTAQVEALAQRTTGEISAPNLTTLTGTLASLAELTQIIGDDTVLTLTDVRVDAADLLALRDSTGNSINADSLISITGTLEDILAIQADGSISKENLIVSLSGETAAADLLTFIAGIDSPIDVSAVTALTGSLQDIKAVLDAGDEEITGLAADLDLKIEDSAANLLNPDNAAILADASVVTVTGNATGTLSIAEQVQLAGLTTDDRWTYSLEDSAANLLNPANADAVAGASALSLLGDDAGALTLAQYNALAALLDQDYAWTYSIADTVANLLAADADILEGAENVILVGNAGGALTVADIGQLDALIDIDTLTYSLSDSEANLWNGTAASEFIKPGVAVNVTGLASVAGLAAIDAANGAANVTYGTLTGSPAELTADAQLNDGRGQYVSGSHPVIVDGEPSVFQLNTINTAAGGIVTATISGAAADLAQLIPGDNAYTVTVNGPATLDQLTAIDAATTVALNYGAVSGTAAALAADSQLNGGNGKYVSGSHDVTVTDTPTVLQLNIINAATSGVVSASISGTAAELSALVEGNNAYTITVSAGPATAAQLNTINAATSVLVDATAITAITGTAAQFESLLNEANAIPATIELAADFAATVSDTVTVDLLNALNTATEGVVTAAISGTADALSELDAGDNAYSITVEGVATAADLLIIDNATTVVVNASAVTEITGSFTGFAILKFAAAELNAINLAADYAAVVTDASISVADANILNGFTTGTVTATLGSNDAAELAGLNGTDNAYTISVAGEATAAQLNAINAATTVAVTATAVTAISGSTADFSSLLEAAAADPATISLADNFTATVDDAASVTLLNALNAATTGLVTASITGTAEDLAQLNATDGVNAYSITVTGAATVAQLVAIYAATSNPVNAAAVTTITGTAAEFDALLLAVTDNEITLGNFAAVVDGEVTVDQLNALDAVTTGVITAAISGTAGELDLLLENDNAYTITVEGEASLGQLFRIDAATSIDLTYAGITGTELDFFTADDGAVLTANALAYVNNGHAVTVTDGLTVAQANILDGLTDQPITATLSGTAAELDLLAEGDNAYTIEVTDTATLAQLVSIDAATNLELTYAGITGVSADFFEEDGVTLTANAQAYVKDGHAVTVTDGLTVAQANILDGLTDQPITASITETDASILAELTGSNAYSITVQGAANAADLTAIDAATTVLVNANVVGIVGSYDELLAVKTAAEAEPASINLPETFIILVGTVDGEVPVLGQISVEQANVLAAFAGEEGGVYAAITDTDAATLATLTGTNNVYDITVLDVATAEQLIAIDNAVLSHGAINATGVTSISGWAADIETVLDAAAGDTPSISLGDTFSLTVNDSISVEQANAFDAATTDIVTATINTDDAEMLATLTGTNNAYSINVAGEATAAQLIAIDGATTSAVTANSVTAITGTAEEFAALLSAVEDDEITLGNFAATVTGVVTVEQLNALIAITTGVITASITGTAAELEELTEGANTLTITITDAATLEQLASIDATTTVDLIYSEVRDTAEALINDAKTNDGTGTYVTAAIDVTVTDAPTVDQLNTINNATTGIVTASISGTAAQLGQLIPGLNNYTVTVTGPATLEQLDVIDFATVGEVIYQGITGVELDFFTADNGTTLTANALTYVKDGHAVTVTDGLTVAQANILDGLTDQLITASITETDASILAELTGSNAYTITVEGVATAADLLSIDAATTVVVNANGVTEITGTLEEFTTLLELAATPASITLTGYYDAVVTDESISVADANVLDAAIGGVVTATITETDAETLVGLLSEFTVFTPLSVNAYTITVEGTATAEQLNIINIATSVAVDASAVIAIDGNAEQLAALLEAANDDPATISLADNFTVTVDDAASVTLLNALNAATTGVVTASITGTAAELELLDAGENAYTITVTGAATVAQLVAIYAATSNPVNAAAVSPITGTAAEFDALLLAVTDNEITLGNFAATVTGAVTVDQLNALDAITTAEITATISGTAAELADLDPSENAYTVTVTDTATLAQLMSIHQATDAEVTYAGITGTAADFFVADSATLADGVQHYVTANHAVTVTDGNISAAQANALDTATSGLVTATLSGTAAELATLEDNDNAYTIEVTDTATLAQLASIDAATNLELTYAGITGVSTDFFEADSTTLTDTAGDYVTADHAVTVTGGALTAGQASALAGKTTGLVTAAVSDTAEALAALAAGNNKFSIEVTDIVTLSQLASIDAATTGTITYGAITGSAVELYLDARQNGGTGVYVKGEHDVTVDDSATVLQLNTIDAAVSGIVTATITGTAAELAGLLPGTNAYTIHLTDTPTPEQWAIIQASTSIPVSVTVNGTVGNDVFDYSAYSTGLTINGDAGNDIIIGGAGNDVINGGAGVDTLFGGDGNDLFIVGEDAVGEAYDGGDGTNTVRVTGTGINLTDDHLLNIQHIEIAEGASAIVNLEQAALVTAGVYFIVDTAEAILDALEDGAVLGAEGVETNDLTVVTLTVAEAGALQSAGVTITAGYTIVDTAAAILDALEDGAVEGALSLATNDEDAVDLTVEEAGKLQTADVSFANGYNIVDSAANILDALEDDAVLGQSLATNDEDAVDLTVAEAGALQTAGVTIIAGYTIVDTAAAILDAKQLVLDGAETVTANGTAGNETLEFSELDLADGQLIINAGAGNDTLIGSLFGDTMYGGEGDDTYAVNSQFDIIVEQANEGTDLVESSIDYTLGENLENLTLTGVLNLNGTGNALDNVITGNAGDNVIQGNEGNDTLIGGAGNDTLFGGDGDDILVGGAGTDTLWGGAGDDTFVYMQASDSAYVVGGDGSTFDSIMDFAAGDTINLSALDLQASVVEVGGSFATYAAAEEAAMLAFDGGHGVYVSLIDDGSDTAYVFVNANNNSALDDGDMAIKLVGVAGPIADTNFML